MTYKEFYHASQKLQKFFKEQEKLSAVLEVLSPTSTGVCEFGNEFIDDYIRVVEGALEDINGNFSWFIFENDFGKNKMEVKIDDKTYKICNEHDFYDHLINT